MGYNFDKDNERGFVTLRLVVDVNSCDHPNVIEFLKVGEYQGRKLSIYAPDSLFLEICKPVNDQQRVENFQGKMRAFSKYEKNLKVCRYIGELLKEEVGENNFKGELIDEVMSKWVSETSLKIQSGVVGIDLKAVYENVRNNLGEIVQSKLNPSERKNQTIKMIQAIKQEFGAELVKVIRKNSTFSPSILLRHEYIPRKVIEVISQNLRQDSNLDSVKISYDSTTAYFCRYILLQALHWSSHGGADNRPENKFQNDNIDLDYCVVASSLNGYLISEDEFQIKTFVEHELGHRCDQFSLEEYLDILRAMNLKIADKLEQYKNVANIVKSYQYNGLEDE